MDLVTCILFMEICSSAKNDLATIFESNMNVHWTAFTYFKFPQRVCCRFIIRILFSYGRIRYDYIAYSGNAKNGSLPDHNHAVTAIFLN